MKVKLIAGAAGALVLAAGTGATGALAVSRALDGEEEGRRQSFPGRFEQRDYEREAPPRSDREWEYRWSGHFGSLDAAASYLDLTQDDLRERLRDGETLAEIARDENKSVAGLVQALVDGVTTRLDEAVAGGRLTREQADAIEEGLEDRLTDVVNGERPLGPSFEIPRFGRDFGPPAGPFGHPNA